MKTVILCGGRGTRLSEETQVKPKPMIEIGDRPILWHIMNIYAAAGFTDFVLALGYKGEMIKDYFVNYHLHTSEVCIDLKTGSMHTADSDMDHWTVNLIDTGKDTLTGGRLGRLKPKLKHGGAFMLTYGDGVADINVGEVLAFHRAHGKLATVTAVRPPARFGNLIFDGDSIVEFKEKPQTGEGWINGGFFVFEPEVLDYIAGDETVLEGEPLERLASDGQLAGFRHHGFWHPMDTLRERYELESMWHSGNAPWRIW